MTAARSKPANLDAFPTLNLTKWIRQNKANLTPPVSNKQLFTDAKDVILFVSGGPNTRNDFHVNPTEELFYQIKGDIAVRLRPLDGSKPVDRVIKEGELFLLPRWVPHRPQRPKGTLGWIAEFPRGLDDQGNPQKDGLQWYCPQCDTLVHDVRWVLRKIDEDLKTIMNGFWDGPVENRTCKNCGYVIERAGAIKLKGGKVKAVGKTAPRTKPARKKTATAMAGGAKRASAGRR
jgi:3-hydroxyanthranilate 3,4-dioxygenase